MEAVDKQLGFGEMGRTLEQRAALCLPEHHVRAKLR